MSNFWDKQEEIARVEKNKREVVVASKCERQGKEYLDVRIHAMSKSNDEYVPTSKGWALEYNQGLELLKNILK